MKFDLHKKQHFLNMHDMRFVDPEVDPNSELAFSISLFQSDYGKSLDTQYISMFNDVFSKPAIWSAMSFLYNSDLGRNGVKFYFHIEDIVYDIVEPYLKSQGVPEMYIRRVELPTEYRYNSEIPHTQFGKKFMAFYDNDLNVENINIIDSDFFLCSKNRVEMYRDLTSPVLKNRISVYNFSFIRFNYCYYIKRPYYAAGVVPSEIYGKGWTIEGKDIWESQNMIQPEKLEEYCFEKWGLPYNLAEDITAYNYTHRPMCSANLLQIPTDHEFIEWFKRLGHQCYHEEGLLEMYFLGKNIVPPNLSEILNIPRYIFQDDYKENQDAYLAHYLDAHQNLHTDCYIDFYLSMLRLYHQIYEVAI